MTKTDNYNRGENHVLRKENSETKFTVRLHFLQEHEDDKLIEEIRKILKETYIKNVIPK